MLPSVAEYVRATTHCRRQPEAEATQEPGSREPGSRESGSREPGSREPGPRDPSSREPGTCIGFHFGLLAVF